ncbi:ribosomal protein S18 [Radiomyces spectabilis]|uniref:ribosomal protein S18 n=1 Tax=Radiomyces spectabilis TaxID=64574 RepID=UPI00222106BB|nr:ribosomal protein S18 [Radiomyces spectabilis]KAI8377854.1 ribosomal protein S18 [Radiomyces spectabilis]
MYAATRAVTRLSTMARPTVLSRCMSTRPDAPAATDATSPAQSNTQSIELATLALLQESVSKEKSKPVTEAVQRYQKIHRVGDTYHPDDLNDARYQEQLRARRGQAKANLQDPFDVLGLDPLHEYKNYRLLSNFVSDMGKILPRQQTGLTAKNQRKLAKAIKRARAMGIMSCTSKEHTSDFPLRSSARRGF